MHFASPVTGADVALPGRMIVLISGWAGFRASLLPLALALRQRLERDVVRADLGFGLGCIRESAQRALREIERARGRSSERVDIVAHSMGGLVASYLLKCLDRGRTIRSVVTLGTPHRGSPAVLFARALARGPLEFASSSLRQMAPESAFLQELAGVDVPEHSQLVSIAGLDDGIVPALYAELPPGPRQFTCRIAGIGHLGLLFSRAAIREIEGWLSPCARTAQPRRRAYSPGGSAILTRRLSTHS